MDLFNQNYQEIKKNLCEKSLPKHDYFFDLADSASTILEKENKKYRPLDNKNEPGSLLDFHNDKLPVIVVPDLHARPDFLMHILDYKIFEKTTVYEALKQKKIRVVCVGDILHSEHKTKERWFAAQTEFESDIYTGPSMSQEMQAGLSLYCGILKLKMSFPEHFHLLKGNHENIFNVTENGDYSFRKYADEGHMVKCFIQDYYGDDILYMIHCIERSLPLVYFGKKCVISHAEPKSVFTKEQLINARSDSSIVEALTWTDNDEAEEGSVLGIIKNLAGDNIDDYVYIGGHRPVANSYETRQNGLYVQIHNPSRQQIAYIDSKNKFNLEKSIIEVYK